MSRSSEFDETDRGEITKIARVPQCGSRARPQIIGYADPEGEAAANLTSSRLRAEAVRAALTEAGAAAVAAQGETGDAAIRGNRKVEVRVTAR